jgi:hypothetical protein
MPCPRKEADKMNHARLKPAAFQVYPLTPKRWIDFEKL